MSERGRLSLRDVDETIRKTQAARVIDVSVATLDRWITHGIVPVGRPASGRPRVPQAVARDLAERVADLRDRGHDRDLIVAVVDQLQRDDATSQREFRKLYGPGLRALATDELLSAAPRADFGPDD